MGCGFITTKYNNMFQTKINEILNYNNFTNNKKINLLLEIDCNMYTNLGSDSTKSEKLETKRKSRIIYRAIKTIDKKTGDQFLNALDQ